MSFLNTPDHAVENVPQYGFMNLSPYLQTAIQERERRVRELIHAVNPEYFFWPNKIEDEEGQEWVQVNGIDFEANIRYLSVVNYNAVDMTRNNPQEAFIFLTSLYLKLKVNNDINSTPDYLRFLGEYLSATEKSGHLNVWRNILLEIGCLVDQHVKIITGKTMNELLGSQEFGEIKISNEYILAYRWTILNTVGNLAAFYFSIGEFELWKRYTALCKILAKFLQSSQALYDSTMEKIVATLNRKDYNSEDIDRLIKEAHEYFDMLMYVYRNIPEVGKEFARESETMMRIIELRLRTEAIQEWGIEEVAELLKERDMLMRDRESLTLDERWLLIHVEILLYIAVDKLLDTPDAIVKWLQADLDSMIAILQSGRKINSEGFELEEYLKSTNSGLFLGSYVDLFSHRVHTTVSNGASEEGKIDKAHLLKMMMEIYRIATEKWIDRSILDKKRYFQKFLDSSIELIAKYYPELASINTSTIYNLFAELSGKWASAIPIVNTIRSDIGTQIDTKVNVLFGWMAAEKIHAGQRVRVGNFSPDKDLMKCMWDFLIIDFPDGEACSLTEWWAGSYTLRGWIAKNTVDKLPPFTAISYIKIDPDGTLHTELPNCTNPDDQEKFVEQFKVILNKLQPDDLKIKYSIGDTLGKNLIYSDSFGSIYADGINSNGDRVFIVEWNKGRSGTFRCEINTFEKDWVHYIYCGSLINSIDWEKVSVPLWWLWQCLAASMKIHYKKVIVLFKRDSAGRHNEREKLMTLPAYIRVFAPGWPNIPAVREDLLHSWFPEITVSP